jgi:hypothetical protein
MKMQRAALATAFADALNRHAEMQRRIHPFADALKCRAKNNNFTQLHT